MKIFVTIVGKGKSKRIDSSTKESNLEDKVWVIEYLKTIFSSKEKPYPAIIWEKVSKFGGKLYKYYSFEDKYAIENLKKWCGSFFKA